MKTATPLDHVIVQNAARADTTAPRYLVIDSHTGRIMGRYKTRPRARLAADRRDNEYGAYRYKVRDTVTGIAF